MEPRLLSQLQAAKYCGYCVSRFSQLVRDGIFPKPIPATHRWDKKNLDLTLDQLSGIETNKELTALERWKARQDGKRGT